MSVIDDKKKAAGTTAGPTKGVIRKPGAVNAAAKPPATSGAAPKPEGPPPNGAPRRPGAEGQEPPANPFTDIPAGAPYAPAVDWAVAKGIASGISETEFAPDAACTRGQTVTFIWRAKGSPAAGNAAHPFTDVAADSPYQDAITWAFANGVATGSENSAFNPDAPCTKGQLLTFLWRAQRKPAAKGESALAAATSDYYTEALAWADTRQILPPGTTSFDSDAPCSRADVVDTLFHALGRPAKPPRP